MMVDYLKKIEDKEAEFYSLFGRMEAVSLPMVLT